MENENNKLENFVLQNMGLPSGSNELLQTAKQLKENYFGNKPVSLETLDEFVAVSWSYIIENIYFLIELSYKLINFSYIYKLSVCNEV